MTTTLTELLLRIPPNHMQECPDDPAFFKACEDSVSYMHSQKPPGEFDFYDGNPVMALKYWKLKTAFHHRQRIYDNPLFKARTPAP